MNKLFFTFFISIGIGRSAISVVNATPTATPSNVCITANYGSTSLACTAAILPIGGNAIWVGAYTETSGAVSTVVDNQTGAPNTYTQSGPSAVGANGTWQWFVSPSITVNTGTFTVTVSISAVGRINIYLVQVNGMATSSFLDASSSGVIGVISPAPCGTTTTTNASDLILMGGASNNYNGTVTVTPASPDTTTYVLQSQGAASSGGDTDWGGVAAAVVSSTGSYKPQMVTSGGGFGASIACVTLALKSGAASVRHRVVITIGE